MANVSPKMKTWRKIVTNRVVCVNLLKQQQQHHPEQRQQLRHQRQQNRLLKIARIRMRLIVKVVQARY